jgi:hypothetical protein
MQATHRAATALTLAPAVAGAWERQDVKDHFGDVIGQATVQMGTMTDVSSTTEAGLILRHLKKNNTSTCQLMFVGTDPLAFFGVNGTKLQAQYRVDKGDKGSTFVVAGEDLKTLFMEHSAAESILRQLVTSEEVTIVVQRALP